MNCKICDTESRPFASAKVLGKYDVEYFQCPRCRFVQTEDPYWLSEAYSSEIHSQDMGMPSRNVYLATVSVSIISMLFGGRGRYLDYGGGYGMYVRLMRDRGFDFSWYDAHSENLFAQGFAGDLQKKYDLLTSFEMFEHLQDPVAEIESMFQLAPTLFFSTELLPETNPTPAEWWYYNPDHGQHISVFSSEALQILAERFGVRVYSNGMLHLFSPEKLSPIRFRIAARYRFALIYAAFSRRPGLLASDFAAVHGAKDGQA